MYGSVKNDLILAPECRKCTLRGSDFKSFPGEHAPWTPLEGHACGTSNPFAAYFYISAAYFDSYWKPCIPISVKGVLLKERLGEINFQVKKARISDTTICGRLPSEALRTKSCPHEFSVHIQRFYWRNKMCVHVEGDGIWGGGGGYSPGPSPRFFFSSTPPPSPEDRPWRLLGWAPKVMAWAPNFWC